MAVDVLPDKINTARLRLRKPVVADAHAIFNAYARDPEVCRFMVWTPHVAEATTFAFIDACIDAWKTGSRFPYVITERPSDSPIGMIDARILSTTVDIGYVMARTHWGRGLMPETIRAFADTALQRSPFFRVQATCDVENMASQRALEKAGFLREGRLERHTVHPNLSPEPRACFMYARCR